MKHRRLTPANIVPMGERRYDSRVKGAAVIPKPKNRFWIFHTVYWVIAGLALFLYGLRYGHWEIALIRNIYSPVLGFAVSFLMSVAYAQRMPQQNGRRLLFVLGASVVGATLSALIVNPITYGLLGYDLRALTAADIFTDGLYFALFYLVWSLLYLQISGVALFGAVESGAIEEMPIKPQSPIETINVEKAGAKLKLYVGDITHIVASGDYVEFFTVSDSYLKLGTISSYEEALKPGPFKRIHRSTIVNGAKVTSISGPTKGQYWLKLEGGHELRSSRNAQSVVEAMAPKAE